MSSDEIHAAFNFLREIGEHTDEEMAKFKESLEKNRPKGIEYLRSVLTKGVLARAELMLQLQQIPAHERDPEETQAQQLEIQELGSKLDEFALFIVKLEGR